MSLEEIRKMLSIKKPKYDIVHIDYASLYPNVQNKIDINYVRNQLRRNKIKKIFELS